MKRIKKLVNSVKCKNLIINDIKKVKDINKLLESPTYNKIEGYILSIKLDDFYESYLFTIDFDVTKKDIYIYFMSITSYISILDISNINKIIITLNTLLKNVYKNYNVIWA